MVGVIEEGAGRDWVSLRGPAWLHMSGILPTTGSMS